MLTTLGRAVVLARSGSTGTGTAGLLDAQSPALVDLALQALLGSVCLIRGNHLDETEATRLLGMRVAHDVALLDLAILLEQTCDLILGQGGVDASDEEVGALVAALLRLTIARLRRRATRGRSASCPSTWKAEIHTGCHGRRGRWGRHCGRARCHHHAHGAVTCCGRAHSREARLRVEVSEWRRDTGAMRQTVVAALVVVLVFHLVLRCGLQC